MDGPINTYIMRNKGQFVREVVRVWVFKVTKLDCRAKNEDILWVYSEKGQLNNQPLPGVSREVLWEV